MPQIVSDGVMSIKVMPGSPGCLLLLGGSGKVEVLHYLEVIDRLFCSSPRFPTDDWVKHWLNRNWRDALHYHLATLECAYEDESDFDGRIRLEILSAYRQQAEMPTRVLNPGNDKPLPRGKTQAGQRSLSDLLVNRRTTRRFSATYASLGSVSQLLWDGLTDVRTFRNRRPTDRLNVLRSFGVAFDFYAGIYRVNEIEAGIYTLNLTDHALSAVSAGDHSEEIELLLQSQGNVSNSCLTLFFVCDIEQYMWRYRHERALRNLFIEAGRIAQRLIIVGENLGFRSFMTPACSDRRLSKLLRLDDIKQYPVYSVTFGYKPS